MTETFSDPMENGLMLISYPMTEAVYCEDGLPDSNFINADVSIADCHNFKSWCNCYDCAKKRYMVTFKTRDGKIIEADTEDRCTALTAAWKELTIMNVSKANFLCHEVHIIPAGMNAVPQKSIFNKELEIFVKPKRKVSIQSAYPLFLFEYFHGNGVI